MQFLDAAAADFEQAFTRIVRNNRDNDADVGRDVATILNEVRARGDDALVEYTMRFDGHRLTDDGDWRISAEQCRAAYDALDPTLRDALQLAADRIRAYHEQQLPQDSDRTDGIGMRLGSRWLPVDAAGLYVPGGRASYPSSLLMNAIPAKVAGVKRLAVATPTPKGGTNALVLAAAHIAGIDEIWRVGGAQAVAALAYGTKRIAKVDVVTGPGNAWVAEAKRQLYGVVGIDMVAGPSEILVIADADNDPEWIAADLLSQAEHDPTSQSILFTDDADFADAVAAAVAQVIPTLSTAATMQASWADNGAVIVVPRLADAI
ncbi:MAG: histidinol dehydrogenase, partial [Alphaproteobacteria bacterium]|nr:histidinol dehydrogenase [Alphaproteobacteria bacterium]